MAERACSSCQRLFPEEKLLLTGDGTLCPTCELEPTEDVDNFEKKLHRKSATGALGLAVLSLVVVFVFPLGLIATVPGFVKLASSAVKGGREHGDMVAIGISVAGGLILLLALLLIALR